MACLLGTLTPLAAGAAAAAAAPTATEGGWPTVASGAGPNGIEFVGRDHGWLAGGAGYVYRTVDGGTTWSTHGTDTHAALLAVDFVDRHHGWAVGADATVMVTTDGGTTWTAQTAPNTSSFPSWEAAYTDVSFVDRDRGWIVSRVAVLGTVDGGRTWAVSFDDPGYELTALDFVDGLHGWVAGLKGNQSAVLATVDGGRTWASHPTPLLHHPNLTVDFVDPLNGWAASHHDVYQTNDGGVTWQNRRPEISSDSPSHSGVSFVDPLHGYVVGRFTFRTDDGGQTWHKLTPPVSGHRVVAVDATHVRMAIGGHGVVTSDDGGLTWARHQVTATTGDYLNDVHFVDDRHGWVVGDRGVIRRTDDGGTTWVDQASGTAEPLLDVTFVDLQHGTAVGGLDSSTGEGPGVIVHTADGGATWTVQASPVPDPDPFKAVFFLDPLHGWVAGPGGFLSTVDGGQTWVQGAYLYDASEIFFTDLQHGFVGGYGRVHVTTDGGVTWTVRSPLAGLRVPVVQRAGGGHGIHRPEPRVGRGRPLFRPHRRRGRDLVGAGPVAVRRGLRRRPAHRRRVPVPDRRLGRHQLRPGYPHRGRRVDVAAVPDLGAQ